MLSTVSHGFLRKCLLDYGKSRAQFGQKTKGVSLVLGSTQYGHSVPAPLRQSGHCYMNLYCVGCNIVCGEQDEPS